MINATKFIKSEFSRNSLYLVMGTVVTQAVPFILHPFLRRLYTPETFGAFALYLNFVSILVIVSSLRYEAAIVLPREEWESINLVALCGFLNLFTSGLTFLILFLFNEVICRLLNFPIAYSDYLYFLPVSILFFGLYQNINYWLTRQKAFRLASINKITRRGTEGIVQITSGKLGYAFGLYLGDIIGNISNFISGWRQLLKTNFNIREVSVERMLNISKKYREFPIYNLFPTLMSTAAGILPFFIINKFYSTETVGFLDLSRLILMVPFALISQTFSQVIFQQIAEKKNKSETLINDLLPVFYTVASIGIVEAVVVWLWGPGLFGLVFGDQYEISGQFARILMFSFFFNFIVSSFSSIYIALEKIKISSFWQICHFLSMCSLLLLSNCSIQTFLYYYVGIEGALYVVNLSILIYIIFRYERTIKFSRSY